MRRAVAILIVFVLLGGLAALLGMGARPHNASQSFRQAQSALSSGDYRMASVYLAQAAKLFPQRPELWKQAGQYALQGGDPQAAILYYKHAAPKGMLAADLDRLGQAYEQSGDLEHAVRSWEAAVAQSPNSETYRRLLNAHLALDDCEAAIHDLQALVKLEPGDAELYYQLGLLTATQDPEAALANLDRAAELDASLAARSRSLQRAITAGRSSDEPAYSLLAAGRGLADLGEWRYASEAFHQATLLRPDYAEAWAYLGEALQHHAAPWGEGNTPTPAAEIGLNELQKALKLDPRSIAAHLFMALYWQRQARFDLALEVLKGAIQLEPDNPVLQSELGNTLAMEGDLENARGAYQKAIDLAAQDARYYNLLTGFSLKYNYQIQELALPAARRAIILAPKDPATLDWMAQVLIRLNDLASAERYLLQALEADPGFVPAHLHLGTVNLFRNESKQALEEFNKVLQLAPDSPEAEQARRLIENNF